MGFFDGIANIFKATEQIQTKQAPVVMYSGVPRSYHGKNDYKDYADEGYQQNAVVYRCVNEIAQGAASVPFKLFSGEDVVESHPLLGLLNRPNPQMAGVEYFQCLISHLLISGNAYAIKTVVNGLPREMHMLRPDRMRVVPSKTNIPSKYEYVINGKVNATFDVDSETGESEVKHFKLFNPMDDYLGLSPLAAASADIDQHNLSAHHNVNLLKNGARPSGAIVFNPKDESGMTVQLSEQQRSQLTADLESRFSGQGNAGRAMLLEGDFDWKEMGLSPRDMDFLQLKNMSARDIALCFGVPAQLVGVPDAQTYANMAEARLALYEETIIPLIKRLESDLNEWLAPMYDEELALSFDIDQIPAMAERRRKIYENVVQAVREGIISRNEARERLDLGPIEGGDDVYISANLFPLGSPAQSEAESTATPEEAEKDAYGVKLDEYPDGEKVPASLPDAYQLGNRAKNCANCAFYEEDTDYCTKWAAEVRAEYVCAVWEPIDEEKQPDDPRFGGGKDVFETQPEAEARARQLGCDGTHTLKGPDGNYYMPCSSHSIYMRVIEEQGDDAKAESDVDTKPTQEMASEAERGLKLRAEFNRGGTEVGVARAVQLRGRERLSPRTVRRMHSFFSRHEVDKRAEGFRQGEDGYPSAGKIAWLLWGGDAGQRWARRKVAELDKERGKSIEIEDVMLPCCDDCGGKELDQSNFEEKVQITAKVKEAIANKVKEHNDKHGDKKGKRVTQRMLEAVFRRGVGAYRTNPESVRRNVTGPDQWAYARINAFLYAVRTGKFRSGKFDLDLLPSGHPLRSK